MSVSDTNSGSKEKTASAPVWFWIVSGLALAWNLMGLLAFFAQFFSTPEMLAALPEQQQQLFTNLPTWYWGVFGMAVVGGTLGCVGLLFKKKWSLIFFFASLLGIVLQQTYMYFMSDTIEVLGVSAATLPTVVLLVALALIQFSLLSSKRGWLK